MSTCKNEAILKVHLILKTLREINMNIKLNQQQLEYIIYSNSHFKTFNWE